MSENNENRASGSKDSAGQTRTPAPLPKRGSSSLGRRALIYSMALAVVFVVGFVPMWFKAGSRAKERDTAQRELRLAQVQLALASAALDARRGKYEPARLSTVSFFTTLAAEMERGKDSAISPVQRDALQLLLQQRDDLVTLLARSDPASAERLANLHAAFRKAAGN